MSMIYITSEMWILQCAHLDHEIFLLKNNLNIRSLAACSLKTKN